MQTETPSTGTRSSGDMAAPLSMTGVSAAVNEEWHWMVSQFGFMEPKTDLQVLRSYTLSHPE